MKTSLALIVLAAAALPALTAPTLKNEVSEDQPARLTASVSAGDEKTPFATRVDAAAVAPCPFAGGYGGSYGGYGAGLSYGHGGVAGLPLGHGALLAPVIQKPIPFAGYGFQGPVSYGFGSGSSFGHYRAAEELGKIQQKDAAMNTAQVKAQKELNSGVSAMSDSQGASARTAFYGGDFYGSGLHGSGLAFGGGAPVGVFPGGLGGCGGIPLLVSCTPSLVTGQLVHGHGLGYGGYGFGHGFGHGATAVFGGHKSYRANSGKVTEGKEQMTAGDQKPSTPKTGQQTMPGPASQVVHAKFSTSSQSFQKGNGGDNNALSG